MQFQDLLFFCVKDCAVLLNDNSSLSPGLFFQVTMYKNELIDDV